MIEQFYRGELHLALKLELSKKGKHKGVLYMNIKKAKRLISSWLQAKN